MLERTRLRGEVITRLKDANTAAGENVFRSRLDDIVDTECPAICVYTLSEVGSGDGGNNIPLFDVNLTLKIDVYVATATDWDDQLDNICEQIETTLLNSPDFVKQFSDISSYSTSIQLTNGGEVPVATASITIGLKYRAEFQPIIPDDLKASHLSTESTGPVRIIINHEQ